MVLDGVYEQPDYFAFLLRLWRVTVEGKPTWRASLESPHTGKVLAFADLESLCAFLYARTGDRPLEVGVDLSLGGPGKEETSRTRASLYER